KTGCACVFYFCARPSSLAANDMQPIFGRRRADAHVAVGGDVDRTGRRAGPDAEGELRAAGDVADEEVGLVGADVPGLGREAAGVVLLQAQGWCVAGVDVEVEHRGGGAEADPAGRVDEERVGGRAAGYGDGHGGRRDVLDGELVGASRGRVVGGELPIVVGEAGAGRGVV